MQAETRQEFLVVSDVDSHTQCAMRVIVENGELVEVLGDPADPESKGELSIREEHLRERRQRGPL